MRSKRKQKNMLLSFLLLFTVFLYGCGGSAGVQESTIRIEMRDVTTKAPIEDVQIILDARDPNPTSGQATHLRRQMGTDSRGKVVFSDLPPDRLYNINVAKDGFTALNNADNDAPAWIPAIDNGGFVTEQGKTYELIGYMRRADSPTTGTIRGYVYDQLTGQPVTNATVFIQVTNPAGNYSIIDTTNKPSKPGYFELTNLPSGGQNLQVTSPGYLGTNVAVTIPQGGTIDFNVNLATSLGSLRLTLQAAAGEVFMQQHLFLVQVLRNGTTIVAQQVVNPTADATKIVSVLFGGDNSGVPVIPTGSTDTYTVKVVSEHAHMSNPANGLTGIVLRGRTVDGDGGGGGTVADIDAGTIVMTVEKGVVELTLYQPQNTVNINPDQTDARLREQASQASMLVENASITSRYTGESPNYYFHYILEEVPVGNRKILINFPGHQLADGGNNEIDGVTVLKDKTVKLLRTMQWTTN